MRSTLTSELPRQSAAKVDFLLRKILLICGPLSSFLYLVAIDVVAAVRYPGYHAYTDQMVSELMAVGAPTRDLLVGLFIPYNVLTFAFAAGVWSSREAKRSVVVTAILLFCYAASSSAGLVLFPMDLRGTVNSTRDLGHIVATSVMSLFIVATLISGALIRKGAFRYFTLFAVVVVMVFGALAGYLATPMPGPTPALGLAERVNIYTWMFWVSALALVCWPRSDSSDR